MWRRSDQDLIHLGTEEAGKGIFGIIDRRSISMLPSYGCRKLTRLTLALTITFQMRAYLDNFENLYLVRETQWNAQIQ